jgi:hypothetical protein
MGELAIHRYKSSDFLLTDPAVGFGIPFGLAGKCIDPHSLLQGANIL